MSDPVCCPPAAPRPKVAHPVSEKENYQATGSYEKLGDFDKVYVVSCSRSRISHGLRHADAIHDSCTYPNTVYACLIVQLSTCFPRPALSRPDPTRRTTRLSSSTTSLASGEYDGWITADMQGDDLACEH